MSNTYSRMDFPELNEYTDYVLSLIEHNCDYYSSGLERKIDTNYDVCKSMFSTLVNENDALRIEITELQKRLTALEGKK